MTDPPTDPPAPRTRLAERVIGAWALDVPALAVRIWSGEGALSFDGRTWLGTGGLVTISDLGGDAEEAGDIGARITVRAETPDTIALVSSIHGAPEATVRQLFSPDGGATWREIDVGIVGVLAGARIEDGVWSAELRPREETPEKLVWSAATQDMRAAGDTGFSRLARYAGETGLPAWPPGRESE
ncbi:hypothetical protein [Candidatus Palauibacter sp.]|uniref:hypothetical protein n=1 Tax=Candidatus Palauibacter sp. TaxID=3101350 RepID=UPI003CC5D48B